MLGRCLALVCVLLVGAVAVRADGRSDLAGTWILDPALSDDAAAVIRDGGRRGDGFGREIARGGVGVIGIPPSSLPPRAGGSPAEQYPGAGPVLDGVRRLVIEVGDEAVSFEYGAAARLTYRPSALERAAGASRRADWREEVFEIEHQLSNGAQITERYLFEPRSAELHWTAHFKPPKGAGFDVKRVFYRSRAR